MSWTLCPLPLLVASSAPAVYLTIDKSGKRLKITKAAWELAGLKPSDPLVMESDGERYRVRRAIEGEPVYGILSKPKSETTATFCTGGQILVAAGCAPARVVAVCGDGWVEFDAGAMFDAAKASKPAPVAVRPTLAPALPAQASDPEGGIKPWRVRVAPHIAIEILRRIVAREEVPAIAKEFSILATDVLAVRQMVGDPKILSLRQMDQPEREGAYETALTRWNARYNAPGATR